MLIVDPIRPLALLCLLLVSGLDAARGGQGAQGDGSVQDEMRRFIRQAVTPTTRKTVLRQAPPPTDPPRLANEKVCGSIDINTEVDTLVTLLSRCTVLEGYLSIGPFDDASTSWENVSFPLLREVTDYVLLYRVTGVKSLQALFPNLAVIRGRSMARDYSLVLFENMDLENVGLVALVSIQRGGVFIWRNGQLCHVHTVDWYKVVYKDFYGKISIRENREAGLCGNVCPGNCERFYDSAGGIQRPMCWTAGVCQQAPPTCSGEGAGVAGCCHRNCLSGCYGPSRNECLVCRSVHHNGACMDVCPEFTYKLSDRRCISEEQCRAHRGGTFKLHSGSATAVGKQCVPSCPNRFTDDPTDKNKCIGCIKACPKVCTMNISIGTASEAEQLYKQRCTVINGSLEIQIGKGDQMVAALEQALEDLEEVKDYIRIAQSHALVSLGFFKSLRVIRGERLYLGSYALQVMDNQNLENLIEFKDRAPLEITNKAANMSFHYNPRLCLYKIEDFLLQTKHSKFYTTKDISETSNGDRVACNITKLTILSIMYQWNNEVEVTFSTFRELEAGADDFRALLGYILYYREAPGKNVSKYEGRDACSSDLWKRIDVGPHDLGELTKSAGIDVKKLKPARQYAVYVTTFTISTERKGGQTDIMYFTTRPKQPSKPLEVRTESVGPHDIKVYWKPPKEPNGPVTYYRVRWYKARAPADRLTERNYCKQPIQRPRNYFEELTTTTTPRPDLCPCNATLGGPGGPGAVQRLPDEEMMKDTIDMENFILDNVFYKGDFGGRARRDTHAAGRSRWARQVTGSVSLTTGAPRNTTAPGDGNNTLLVTIPPGLTMPPVTLRTTTPNPKLEARETQVRDAREWRIRGLHHFTDYVISVFACHEPSTDPADTNNSYMYPLCSDEAFANPSQTLAKRGADDIPSASVRVSLNEVNSSSAGAGGQPDEVAVSRNVHVYWKDPHQPNGVIVTVEIEYHLVDKENKSKIECIPRTQRTASHAILDFSHAAAGNYSFRLRASSFASNGSWTEARFVELAALPSTAAGVSMPTLIGIVVGVILAVVLIAVGVFYACRKRLQKALPSPNVVSINPDYYAYKPDEWEVPRENIERGRKIGSGTFGDVYEGIAKNIIAGVERLLVAIKEVDEAKSPSERNFFLQEASIMKNFRCHHVVKLLGIVSEGQPVWVIMEYMANSDLKTWLRNQRPEDDKPDRRPPAVSRMLQMAGEICDGMAYIHSRKFVHRDLAARNCMVADDLTVKIGDFGMTRDVYETDYYRKGGKGLLPVRWMAPESLKDGLFTSESDVWSFGVVLWEIVTLAAQPYQGLSNEQVLHFVLEGRLMPRPENCPDHIYDIMTRCWSFQVHNRPTFLQIIEGLLELDALSAGFKQVSYFSTVDVNDVTPPTDAAAALGGTALAGHELRDLGARVISLLRDPEALQSLDDADADAEPAETASLLDAPPPAANLEPVVIVHENGTGEKNSPPLKDGPGHFPRLNNGGDKITANGLITLY